MLSMYTIHHSANMQMFFSSPRQQCECFTVWSHCLQRKFTLEDVQHCIFSSSHWLWSPHSRITCTLSSLPTAITHSCDRKMIYSIVCSSILMRHSVEFFLLWLSVAQHDIFNCLANPEAERGLANSGNWVCTSHETTVQIWAKN